MENEPKTGKTTDVDSIFKELDRATEKAKTIKDLAYNLNQPIEKGEKDIAKPEHPAVGQRIIARLYDLIEILNDAHTALRNFG